LLGGARHSSGLIPSFAHEREDGVAGFGIILGLSLLLGAIGVLKDVKRDGGYAFLFPMVLMLGIGTALIFWGLSKLLVRH
jgi:hypothetical protein